MRPGMKRANLLAQTAREMPSVFDVAIEELRRENMIVLKHDIVKLFSHEIKLSGEDEIIAQELYEILQRNQFSTPPPKILAQETRRSQDAVLRGLNALLGLDKIVRFEGDIYFTRTALDNAQAKLAQFGKKEFTVSEFREILDTSRKFAVPLLGYFDEMGITERIGDVRIFLEGEKD